MEEDDQLQSDDHDAEGLPDVLLMRHLRFLYWKVLSPSKPKMNHHILMTMMQKAFQITADETSSIPVLEGFEPVKTEDESSHSDDQNAEGLPDTAADEKSSIPVLEGFEPVETEDESLHSDDHDAEGLSDVTADETSSIPVLEGFEPVETEDESLQSDDHDGESSPVSDKMKKRQKIQILLCNALRLKNGPLSYRILVRKSI